MCHTVAELDEFFGQLLSGWGLMTHAGSCYYRWNNRVSYPIMGEMVAIISFTGFDVEYDTRIPSPTSVLKYLRAFRNGQVQGDHDLWTARNHEYYNLGRGNFFKSNRSPRVNEVFQFECRIDTKWKTRTGGISLHDIQS
jgi:hypothetical protein